MSSQPEELFPKEYRHEFVVKTLKGLLERTIVLNLPMDKENYQISYQAYRGLVEDIRNYFSGMFEGKQLDGLEQQLFNILSNFRMTNLIKDAEPKQIVLEQNGEIAKINAKIDSTNRLLADVLRILKELMKKLDK